MNNDNKRSDVIKTLLPIISVLLSLCFLMILIGALPSLGFQLIDINFQGFHFARPTPTPSITPASTLTSVQAIELPTETPFPTALPSATSTHIPTATAIPNITSEDIRIILGLNSTTTIYKAPDGFFISCYDGSFLPNIKANVQSDGTVILNGQPTSSIQEIINAMSFIWPGNYKAFFFVKPDLLDNLPRNVLIYAKGPGGTPEYRNIGPDEFKQHIIEKAFPLGIDDLRIQYIR